MEPTTLQDIAAKAGGSLSEGTGLLAVARLHTDTRTIAPGDCFVALSGERFDGHDFVAAAAKAGAVAALVSRRPPGDLPPGFGMVVVPDVLAGLQRFAAAHRAALPAQVVAVTGSSGKTSTKEMIASVLRERFGDRGIVATEGNLNNHIGVPLTLLRMGAKTKYAVVEMGMNRRGEIAPLAGIARPGIAVVTGVGSAHIENLGSREAIAAEKTDLIAALPSGGTAVLNAADPLLRASAGRAAAGARVVWAGMVEGAAAKDVAWRAEEVRVTPKGVSFRIVGEGESALVRLPLFNRVMVSNALLAAAVGRAAGLSLAEIVRGLEGVRLVGKRMEVSARLGGWIIDDCYNANPESTRGALAALREFPAPARRVAVVGSMGELGDHAPELHRQTGRDAAASGAGLLAFVGPNAADLEAGALEAGYPARALLRFATTAEAALALPGQALVDDTILVKGSRFLKLEQVVSVLRPPSGGAGNRIETQPEIPAVH